MTTTEADNAVERPAGQPASWIEPISTRRRLFAFIWRAGLGCGISAWIAFHDIEEGVSGAQWLWAVGFLAAGLVTGMIAFGKLEARVYETTVVQYSTRDRLKRAAKWFLPGVAILAFVWGVLLLDDQFTYRWWLAWPTMLPIFASLVIYLRRSERVLSGPGQYARQQEKAAKGNRWQLLYDRVDALVTKGLVRYLIAALCFYGSYYFAFEYKDKRAALLALFSLIAGLALARELGKWLLIAAAVVGVGWAVFAGIAALPVSAAIVIGAIIIAFAVRRG